MLVSAVLIASLTLQFVAVYFALRLIKVTGRSLAWSLIAAAIALMALRRSISLEQYLASDGSGGSSLLPELVALSISVLMAFGIERIVPIFTSLMTRAEQLKDNEARYRAVFENSPVAIWEEDFSGAKQLFDRLRGEGVVDIESHFDAHPEIVSQWTELIQVVEINRAALLLHEADDKEALLRGLATTFTPELFATFRDELTALWHGATEMRRDTVVKTLKGELRHVTLTFAICPGHETTLSRVFVSLVDITERTQAKAELVASERQFRRLAENLPDNITRYDRQGRTIYVNPVLEKTLNTGAAQLLGTTAHEFHPNGSYDVYARAVAAALRGENSEFEFAMPGTGPKPDIHQIRMLAERDENGEVTGALAIGRDITQLKRAEQERQTHLAFLAAMDRINRAVQGTSDLDTMMRDALDEVLDIFGCDRAMLTYPCDPAALSWSMPMARSRGEYHDTGTLNRETPMDEGTATTLEVILEGSGAQTFGPGSDQPLPEAAAEHYGSRSFMSLAIYPKRGLPWQLGIHQCAYDRVWTDAERQLLEEIGRRLSDGLTGLLVLRDLRESEAKYRRIFDTTSEGIWGQDKEFATSFVNSRMAEMLGYSVNELLGRPVTDFMFEEDFADHDEKVDNRKKHIAEAYERRFRRKDGGVLWTLISADPVFDDEGVFQGSFAMVADITERKRLEEKFRDSEEKFSRAFHASPTLMAITEPDDGTIVEINESFSRFFGYTREECIGKTTTELNMWVYPEQREQAKRNLVNTESSMFMDVDLRTRSGEIRSVIDSMVFITIRNKRYLLSVATDVTENKRAEAALKRYSDTLETTVQQRTAELRLARDAAEAASRAKSAFLANMSHELRTPLNAILGFSQMMQQDTGLNATQHENLEIINHSGEHLLKLINDVLEIAKIEAGRLQLEIAPFDLHGLVRDVSEMMRLRAEQKGLQLALDQSSEFPRYIKGDEARLRQILVNLVSNAVKFTATGGVTIRLRTTTNDRYHLLIEVEDTGPGISETDRKRLFKPFVQLPEGKMQEGTGLGLAIARQFVRLMEGDISVESQPGKGALFRVELPLEEADMTEVIQLSEERHGQVTGLLPGQPAARILIAEDQRDNQLLLSKLMTDIGLEVKIVDNGAQAVQLFKEWHPDLIWMDWRMPVLDGTEATRQIRQLPGGDKVKIVAVTASAFKEQEPELLAAGMDDYIRKPFLFDEIYDCMAQQLGLGFAYREQADESKAMPEALSPQRLQAIPPALRGELHAALESLDRQRIDAVVSRIGAVDAELGRSLSQLADQFNYPAILGALE